MKHNDSNFQTQFLSLADIILMLDMIIITHNQLDKVYTILHTFNTSAWL